MKAVFLDFATVSAEELDRSSLEKAMPGIRFFETTTPGQVADRIAGAQAVLLNKVCLDASLLSGATDLRFIGLTATGVDNVDLEAAKKQGIAVCNIRSYCTQSVVEHVFGTLLTLTHSLHRFNAAVREGAWQESEEFCLLGYPLRELSAMTMGIVGYGDLGQAVARTAEHFGIQVLVARRPGTKKKDDDRTDLDTLLKKADVVSLHCPLTEDTRGLIGEREFGLMKKDAILVNTARGALVDSAALAAAIREERIGGAAIDVLAQEPPVDGDPLLDCDSPRLFVTPHIAWGTREARQTALDQLAAAWIAFERGEEYNRVV